MCLQEKSEIKIKKMLDKPILQCILYTVNVKSLLQMCAGLPERFGTKPPTTASGAIELLAYAGKRDLYFFCKALLGFGRMKLWPHFPLCRFLERPSKRKLIIVPRKCFKSTIAAIGYPIWRWVTDPNYRVMTISSTDDLAMKKVREVKEQLSENELFMRLYGEWQTKHWSDHHLNIAPRSALVGAGHYSMEAVGITASVSGSHVTDLIPDDMHSDQNSKTAEGAIEVRRGYEAMLPVRALDGQTMLIGTRYHEADQYGRIVDNDFNRINKGWDVFAFGCWDGPEVAAERLGGEIGKWCEDYCKKNPTEERVFFPAEYDIKTLETIRDVDYADNPRGWACQYENRVIPMGEEIISRDKVFENMVKHPSKEGDWKRFILLDAAYTDTKTSDNTFAWLIGFNQDEVTEKNRVILYILDAKIWKKNNPVPIIGQLAVWDDEYKVNIVCETAHAENALIAALDKDVMRSYLKNKFIRVNHSRSKQRQKVDAMTALLERGSLKFSEKLQSNLAFQTFLGEAEMYPHGEHDDSIISLALIAVREINCRPRHKKSNKKRRRPGRGGWYQ